MEAVRRNEAAFQWKDAPPNEAELVGAHGGRAGAIGEEVELALLDAVLHVAAGVSQTRS
jgi:hypothetical protein